MEASGEGIGKLRTQLCGVDKGRRDEGADTEKDNDEDSIENLLSEIIRLFSRRTKMWYAQALKRVKSQN